MRPRIALEMQVTHDRKDFKVPEFYVTWLEEAGADVELVAPSITEEELREVMGRCHGILCPGGDDVNSLLYGEEPLEGVDEPLVVRDEFEALVVPLAFELQVPYFGVCRGTQFLNVARGGSLNQRVSIEELNHWPGNNRSQLVHFVDFEEGSFLGSVVGESHIKVNSYHHQAVLRLGEGVVVEARATDGTIEAIRVEGHPFAMGVQWHPEMMADYPSSKAIARAFVAAAEAYRAGRDA